MQINKTDAYDNNEIRHCYNGTKETFKKCDDLAKDGYLFVPGNNPFMNKTKKWSEYDLVRVAHTNHRKHGKCIQTLWAVK